MVDSAATNNVFIDTEVFDCHQFDFDSLSFRRLVRLAADASVRVLLTTITVSEIKSHFDAHAAKAFKQVTTARSLLPLTRKHVTPEVQKLLESTSVEEFQQALRNAFDRFLADTKAIILSVNDVPAEDIFKAYFEASPPFSDAAKKNEFPDAFASAALRAWAEGEDESVYVVSNDKDWRRMCEIGDTLIHQAKLPELLEKFADTEVVSYARQFIESHRSEVKALLDEEGKNIYFFSIDGVEAEIEEPDEVDVTFEDFNVIEVKDGVVTVSMICDMKYTVTVTDDDPDSGWTDPDDRERRYVFRRSGSIKGETELEATVTLQYSKERPDQITLGEVKFTKPEVEVSFEDDQLSREDDNDYDDMDYPDDEPPDDFSAHGPLEDAEPSDRNP